MLNVMKSAALVLGSLVLVAATPASSSAFFPWWYGPGYYDPWYGGGWGYGRYGYGAMYGAGYQKAFYAPAFDCCCAPACTPCGPVGCSPCGAGGCPGGNCEWNAPAGPPTPQPDSNMSPPRRTYETTPEDGVDAPPSRRRGADPAEDGFVPPRTRGNSTDGDQNRSNEPGADGGAAFDAQKPVLGTETVIPQRPADAAPVKEEGNSRDDEKITIPDKSATRPVIEKHRLTLRVSFSAPKLVRTNVRPAAEWSVAPTDARIAQH